MKKKLSIIITIAILIILAISSVIYFLIRDNDNNRELKDSIIPQVILGDSGSPIFIDGTMLNTKVESEEEVYEALNELKDMYGFNDAKDEFDILSVEEALDFKYYKVNQTYNGVPVYGRQLVVAVDKDNNILSVTGNYYKDINANTYSWISITDGESKLENIYGKDNYKVLKSDKYIYVEEEKPLLVYIYSLINMDGYYKVIMDASNGYIIKTVSETMHSAYQYKGTGDDGKEYAITIDEVGLGIYSIYDPTRNIAIIDASDVAMDFGSSEDPKVINALYFALIHDNMPNLAMNAIMINGELYPVNKDGVLDLLKGNYELKSSYPTLYNFEVTYDYYKNVLGRNSYDNKGSKIIANIGIKNNLIAMPWNNNEYYNASWVGNDIGEFYFGSNEDVTFAVATDIVAHEFTHAVTEYTAGLEYYGESGALNEAYSDIMGNLIEGKNFKVGEDFEEMRDMENPELYDQPSVKDGKYYFPTDSETYDEQWQKDIMEKYEEAGSPLSDWTEWDNAGVHTNSGVPNHAAYLMYNNGAFSSREEMAKVWYNSLFMLTSTSNFEDCAIAVIQSAKALGLSQDKVAIIEDAFEETKMLDREYSEISGKVIDDSTGKAIENVQVSIINKKNVYINYISYTNSNGEYNLKDVPVGEYTVVFEKAKYLSYEKEIELIVDKKSNIDAKLTMIDEANYKEAEIIFVLDISASMTDSDPSDIRKQMMVNVIASLDESAEVALVTYAKNASVINSGLSNKKVDKKILMTDVFNMVNDSGYTDNSGTNGRAGLTKALELFSSNEKSRKYIVFFTDGEDNQNAALTYDEIIDKANSMNVRILSVGLGKDGTINETELKRIASATNGKYYHATSSDDLYKFDKSIFEELE